MMTVVGRDDGWVMTMAYIRFRKASLSSCFFSSDESARERALGEAWGEVMTMDGGGVG